MKTHHPLARTLPALACLLLATSARAAAGESEWTISPYLWIASFEGTVGGGGGDDNTGDTAKFERVWDNLGLAGAMLNVGWRRDRWTAFGDWTYANVRSDSPTRVPSLYDTLEAQVKGHVVQAFVGYDLMPRDNSHLDLYGGARYYNLDISADFSGGALAPRSLHGSRDWFDGVAGLRWTTGFGGNWRAMLSGDVGTGGSNFSWQGYATLGYQFGWGTLFGGWRYLHIDYGDDPYTLDAALTGPFLGAAWTF